LPRPPGRRKRPRRACNRSGPKTKPGAGSLDEVDAAKDRKGQPGITLDPDCKPPWHARRPAGRRDGYGLTLLLTT